MPNETLQKGDSFNDKEIESIVRFEDILRRIHDRLIREGYTINDGQIIEPKSVEGQPQTC